MAERDFHAIYERRKAAGDPNVLYRARGGTTIGLPDELHQRIAEAAEARGVSASWLVRRLLAEGLDNLKPATELRLTKEDA
jgi:predicted HicB family RNase H-like nuclease